MTATADHTAATAGAGAQRLTGPAAVAVTTLLVFSGLFSLAFEVLYLPLYFGRGTVPAADAAVLAAPLAAGPADGAIPFPVTALLAGVLNVVFVIAMRTVTDRPGVALLPLAAWTFGFLVAASGGPGGDILLLSAWPTLALFVCGLAAPLGYTYLRWLVP
ncbi:hypothetical protein ACTD5D_07760 [Nocardia takedensis]|uniref:hypothetical protein n=1 Tax=Nocardia takedensis TaxID=259390 RepID=UPI00030DBC1C|nr:hypothetical protein [Nocardia takedensis]